MKIGIVLHPYNEKSPAGLGRSVLELTQALTLFEAKKKMEKNEYLIYCRDGEKKIVADLPPGPWQVAQLNWRNFIWGFSFWRAPRADLYVFNTPVLPLFFWPRKTVVIVHDLAYWSLPAFGWKNRCRRRLLHFYHWVSLSRARKIIAVSQTTKTDLIKEFRLAASKITVIYWGFKNICRLPVQPISVPLPFFLTVGVIKERKNIQRIVRAFIQIHHLLPVYSLIVVGSGGGSYEAAIKAEITQAGLNDRVKFLGFVNDYQLSYLYTQAKALVFVSLIEGFGFPILEAMAAGLPVITSNLSSLPELAGSAALLVNPYETEEIAQAMLKLARDKNFCETLTSRGYARVKGFSWAKTAKEYNQLFLEMSFNEKN